MTEQRNTVTKLEKEKKKADGENRLTNEPFQAIMSCFNKNLDIEACN